MNCQINIIMIGESEGGKCLSNILGGQRSVLSFANIHLLYIYYIICYYTLIKYSNISSGGGESSDSDLDVLPGNN